MSENDRSRQIQCYKEWKSLQKTEISQLLEILDQNPKPSNYTTELTRLINSVLDNVKAYNVKRSRLAEVDSTPYFAPPWYTSLENSAIWVGGSRPSSYIRLLYALVGLEIESQLEGFLHGVPLRELPGLTASQLEKLNDLQKRTNKEEDKFSLRLASLQEDLADKPLVDAARSPKRDCGASEDVNEAVENSKRSMARLLGEADEFRLKVVRELVTFILTPVQAVEFLAASKKLECCVQEMGEKKDEEHASTK